MDWRPAAVVRAVAVATATGAAACLLAALAHGTPSAVAAVAGEAPAMAPGVAPEVASVTVTDDRGQAVSLPRPARRVVALSPALAELAFAAGGGDRLVAVVTGSDHPPPARALPRIGDSSGLSVEAILAARPELVLAWDGGNDPRPLASLRRLGIPVYLSRIETLEGIATTLERLGRLLGSDGAAAARDFRRRLARMGPAGQGAEAPVRVFYQVWEEPLMTINGRHWISDLIERCGGTNLFGERPELVPRIGLEAVVAAAPQAILAAGHGSAGGPDPFQRWRRFPGIPAVADDFLFLVDGDGVSQTTPRTLDAGEAICRHLDQVRARVRGAGCDRAGSCPGR